jgi:Co/Zn/Cd efflux system component
MKKSTFKISQMDCPSEEKLIRLKLADFASIQGLDFDIPNRCLGVYHTEDIQEIQTALSELKLGEQLLSTEETDQPAAVADETSKQKKLLWAVLLINFAFFLLELGTGIISSSMGLVADSLDMLADSLVYGISLLAVGKSLYRKKRVARLSGYFQISLAVMGFVEVLRRFFSVDALPDYRTMIVVSFFALIANGICLYLLQSSNNKKEVHMQASMIFTSNDVIINLGVIMAALLVYWTNSNKADLLIGSIVFVLVLRGAFRILKLGK